MPEGSGAAFGGALGAQQIAGLRGGGFGTQLVAVEAQGRKPAEALSTLTSTRRHPTGALARAAPSLPSCSRVFFIAASSLQAAPQLKWLWRRLKELAAMKNTREQLLMKLGAARAKAPVGWRLVDVKVDKASAGFTFALNRNKLRTIRRREGRYLLRTNLTESDPATLWQYYIQLVAVEEAFKNLKADLAIRPVFHQEERRIEAHIFIAFLAYCLYVTLQRRLHALAPGLTARSALEKFAAVQMIDVHLPTTDGRELVLTRYTQPEPELQLLINQLKLQLPSQPPPRITAANPTQQTLL